MNPFSSRLTRRLLWALMACFVAIFVWLTLSFLIMHVDHSRQQRLLREAELVAAAIARGGMANRPAARISANPQNPATLAAKQRSPFNKKRAEGIIRQMQAIINKRVILFDHRRRMVLDSYNFTQAEQINVKPLADLTADASEETRNAISDEIITPPSYVPPPKRNSGFILSALAGTPAIREFIPKPDLVDSARLSAEGARQFQPAQPILQAAAPIRRLKIIQGAVIIMDANPSEQTQWQWQTLRATIPIFATAILVGLSLLLFWAREKIIRPLSRLAYGKKYLPAKYKSEIGLLARRQLAMCRAVQSLAHHSENLLPRLSPPSSFSSPHLAPPPLSSDERQKISDLRIAAQIHYELAHAPMELHDLASLLQRVIQRHNQFYQERIYHKMHAQPADQPMPFTDPICLERIDSRGIRHAFMIPLFVEAMERSLDCLISATQSAQMTHWPSSIRVSLKRESKNVKIIIEDDGEDSDSDDLEAWGRRVYHRHDPPLSVVRAIEAVVLVHRGKITISNRPSRLIMTLSLSPVS